MPPERFVGELAAGVWSLLFTRSSGDGSASAHAKGEAGDCHSSGKVTVATGASVLALANPSATRCGALETRTAGRFYDVDYGSTMNIDGLGYELQIELVDPRAQIPTRAHAGDAAFDLYSLDEVDLHPRRSTLVRTGVAIALPPAVAGLVVPRSGLAAKHSVGVTNGPGLIDPNYRGEIKAILINHGTEPYRVARGDRVAQLLLIPFWAPELLVVAELPEAHDERGADGFGSSGS